MKKPPFIYTLIFSTVMFSSISYADWSEMSRGVDGDIFYVDFERIKRHKGHVYFSRMVNYFKPIQGYLSSKVCIQGDCKLFRLKYLSLSYHKKPLGGGAGDTKKISIISSTYDKRSFRNHLQYYAYPRSVKLVLIN